MLPRIQHLWPLALVVLLLASRSEQRGDGAPSRACLDMTPAHSDIVAQTSVPPYVIITSGSQVRQGGKLNVTIASPAGAASPIGGFILQARSVQDQNTILGRFTRVPDPQMEKAVRCQSDNDTVTHTSPQPKYDLTFEWLAPTDFLGSFAFRATVAQGYATFWKNVESSLVEVVTPDTVITTTQRSATTAGSIAGPAFTETQTKKPTVAQDPIYQGCSDTKLCFGSQGNCLSIGNCPAVVAVLVAGDTFTFEVQATGNPTYVAAGLSNDASMGDDSAVECVQNNGKVALFTSWTYPKEEPYVSRKVPQGIVQLKESSYNNGKLYCKFTRDANSTVMGVNFDLVNNMYHLMVVAGSSMKDAERVGFHDLAFERTGVPMKLASVGSAQGASKLLLRLHGAFMVTAWLGSASIGILLARYFRQTWVGKQIGGKDIWFAWHRMLMVLTWLLTMTAFILILVDVGTYRTTGDNPHAITGLITVILCFLQPIGAYFRPHPGTSKRPIFNWLHWLVGNSAHILGIATIFLAVYLNRAELPYWTAFILAAYVVFHVVMHLVLSVTVCVSDGRISNGRVNTFPMKDMAGNVRQATPIDRKTDAPYGGFRRVLLGIYIFFVALLAIVVVCLIALYGGFRRLLLGIYIPVVALLAIAVVCLVALAPITETYNSVSTAINEAMGADGQ